MLRYTIRRLNTALKENPCDYYDYVIKILDNIKLPPKPNLPKDLKNSKLLEINTKHLKHMGLLLLIFLLVFLKLLLKNIYRRLPPFTLFINIHP